MTTSLSRRLTTEFLGTAFLVAAVIGSGVMGERLANGNVALALLANTIATGAALVAIILAFGPISGPHFESCCNVGGCNRERSILESRISVCGRSGCGRHDRRGSRTPDVRASSDFLGMLARPPGVRPIRGRCLHNGCILVYGINVFRQSRCHDREDVKRHLRGNSSRRCPAVHSGSSPWVACRHSPVPLACA